MSSISNIVATTELEAVNTMLSVIGEAPLADGTNLSTATQPDVKLALLILRSAAREVQTRKWRFNTEFGYSLTPSSTVTISGVSCNTFNAPATLASFDITRNTAQKSLDVIIRDSTLVPGTLRFYNRLTNSEGFTAASFATLKIDPVWFLDFEKGPETARRYITILAARRFQQGAVGSVELSGFTAQDEQQALQELEQDQRLGYPVIPDGTPNTLTDALNLILASTGLEPVASSDSPMGDKQSVALNVLRSTMREIQRQGWRFNSEIGYQLAPVTSINWIDRAGVTTALNIFTPPANLARFVVTPSLDQQGSLYKDTALMPSRQYTSGGNPVQVFYDRANNRDGFTSAYLYINPVWYVTFDNMPETARWYVTVVSMRRFSSRITGAPDTFTARDEFTAKRDLQDEQGDMDDYNIFNQADVASALGGRLFGASGVFEFRNTPNKV